MIVFIFVSLILAIKYRYDIAELLPKKETKLKDFDGLDYEEPEKKKPHLRRVK